MYTHTVVTGHKQQVTIQFIVGEENNLSTIVHFLATDRKELKALMLITK